MPSSGRDSSSTGKKVEYENRIRLITDNDSEDEIIPTAGSLAVREGTRMQRRFEQRLEEPEDSKPHALWLSLDPLTGDIFLFPRAAATRLEAGYVNHRCTVPLAGLGGGLENDIVHMGAEGSGEQPVQKSWHGTQMDVRRIKTHVSASQVSIHVFFEDTWRIADVAVPGKTEERHVLLHGAALVRPPSPPLPPLNPDRRMSFCNAGAYSGAEWS
jgi:hypothetical protein